jgi:hypothetical protein
MMKYYPNKPQLYNPHYSKLTPKERELVLLSFPDYDERFSFLRFERFERFGMATDTAVYSCDGQEFVFVPGATVALGWYSFAVGMDARTRHEIAEALTKGDAGVEEFLRQCMSPRRHVCIAPMLVERWHKGIWRDVLLDSPELVNPFREKVDDYLIGNHKPHEDGTCIHFGGTIVRITRDKNGELHTQMYETISLPDFLNKLHGNGFSLPTEDEWEYLCGGGSRTLFRRAYSEYIYPATIHSFLWLVLHKNWSVFF